MKPLTIKTKRYKVPGSRKGKGGVPELYHPDIIPKMIRFFSKEPYRVVTLNDGSKKTYSNDLATMEHFANNVLHVGLQTIRAWGKRHKEFQAAIDRCRELQKNYLIVNGVKGLINSSFGIFVAQNITDLRQKVAVEQTNFYPDGVGIKWSSEKEPAPEVKDEDSNA